MSRSEAPFRATVPYYTRYRLGYPEELIMRVGAAVGLKRADAVMDLGCGPGLLAIAFAGMGAEVTGIDPEAAMLKAADEAAREAGVSIRLLQGSSFELPQGLGSFKLVAMGRSFHWMDRAETLKSLDPLIGPDGAIALFGDDHPRTVENNWLAAMREVGNRYGAEEAPHRRDRNAPGHRANVAFLLDSAFSHVITIGVFVRRALSVDDIVGRAFSLSVLSHERLGDRAEAFEQELRAALARISADGRFTEIAEISATIGLRR